MTSDVQTIPEDIMKAAEEALDNLLCNCRESCGSYEAARQASITDIAKAIFAERERNAQPRRKITEALCELPHSINHDKVELRFDPRRPGNNALDQLITQLEVRFGALKEEA